MAPFKTWDWKGWLLASGLCLVFVSGLVSLPEVGIYWHPLGFWAGEYKRMKEKVILEEIHQGKTEATLQALAWGKQDGFPAPTPVVQPSARGCQQAVERILADRMYVLDRTILFKDMLHRWKKLGDIAPSLSPDAPGSGSPGENLECPAGATLGHR